MALLESFQDEYATTLATAAPFDCARLNRVYHGRADAKRIDVRIAPMPEFLRRARAGDALRGAFFARFVKSIGREFDLCISAYNCIDFGRPAIQFLADFSWDDEMRRAFDPVSPGLRGLTQRRSPMRSAYLAVTNLVSGGRFDPRLHARDIVIANSQWSADQLARRHGISASVICPPVYVPPCDANAARTQDFVMLGRIDPDKRVTEAIEILARVRARGHAFNFHIIGPLDDSPYADRVRKKAAAQGAWVRLHGGLYGDDKFVELGRHAFGLHTRRNEAFGIAVAEMVKMGVVPFVPAGSAPAEIVADARLTFRDPDDAVEVIDRLLKDRDQHSSVRQNLAARAPLFSKENFVRAVRELVETQLLPP